MRLGVKCEGACKNVGTQASTHRKREKVTNRLPRFPRGYTTETPPHAVIFLPNIGLSIF